MVELEASAHRPSQLFSTYYVGEMMIPCQVSTFSEFICSAFQFQGHLAQNKSVNALKIANLIRKGWKLMMWLWMVHFEHRKTMDFKQVKKWNPFVTDEFPYETLYTSKEIVRFVHEVHLVFAVSLSTFLHMLCGWNDDTMPTFNLFRVHL